MRRKNKTVFLQWEPFSGAMAESGVAYLTVTQSISNLPPYVVTIPAVIQYKGVYRPTRIEIDPHSDSNIRIYLNTDGSSSDVNIGDSVSVPGTCVSWIVL